MEKSDTPLKWRVISAIIGKNSLDPAAEPLQTVQRLSAIRNRLAHPKILELGAEIIVRSKDGAIRRNVQPDDKVEDGDLIMLGVGKLLNEHGFSADPNPMN